MMFLHFKIAYMVSRRIEHVDGGMRQLDRIKIQGQQQCHNQMNVEDISVLSSPERLRNHIARRCYT